MRRRRRFQKPEIVRREYPAMIECIGVDLNEPVKVTIGNETYIFTEDGAGRKLAAVTIEDHIACFLARSEMYRQAGA